MNRFKKITILFLLPSLIPGGAERVMSFVAQNIDKNKFEPTLMVAGFEKDASYDVSKVNVIFLNKQRILTAIPLIIYYIFKHRPNIVVSSISHVNTAMSFIAPIFPNTKFIGREATVLSKRKNEKKHRKWSLLNWFSLNYKNLDILICQSQDMADDMIQNYKIQKNKICVINNPISNQLPVKEYIPMSDVSKFITVGRLKEVKGHLRLLEILSKFKGQFIYTIIGDGDLKEEIFKRAECLGIHKRINHISYTKDVSEYISKHDFFLQGSYVEGFPNAVLESCVVGTPVIAFDVPGGTKEILINGVNGYMVNSNEEFLNKLTEKKIWNPKEINESVNKKFNKNIIISKYEGLFMNILK